MVEAQSKFKPDPSGASGAAQNASQTVDPGPVSKASAPPDFVPLAGVRRLAKYPPVEAIVARATETAKAAGPGAAVSTSFVLFAIADEGDADREPQWAGDFLARVVRRVGSAFEDVRENYLSRQRAGGGETATPDDLRATRYLLEDLRRASDIAHNTTGQPTVHTRHLLAALLLDRPNAKPSGAHERVREMGLDPVKLRADYLEFLVGWGDNDEAWERTLTGPATQVQRVLPFSTDGAAGRDLIGIETDVVALATLIAARQVTPPLSVGLFGEWGSGKTFFMRKLQTTIAALAKGARDSGEMQAQQPFYKRIVQIEFNAWHYVEGNLWASLVEHIFDNLKVGGQDDDTVTLQLQRKLLDELKFREKSKDEAQQKERQARSAVDRADTALQQARAERNRKWDELTQLKTRNILAVLPVADLRARLAPVLAALGLADVGATAAELSDAVHRAESVLREGGSVIAPLVHAPDRGLRRVALGAALLLPPLVTVSGAALLKWNGLASLASLFTGLAGAVAATSRWVVRQSDWVRRHLDRVHDVQAAYDGRLRDAVAENERSIASAAQALEAANATHTKARESLESASRAHERAQQRLAAATSGRLLASFIEDRASSTDYRKHLGLLAVVRDDFERLSGLIDDENWKLSPPVEGENPRPGLTRFASLEEEERDIGSRVNRIVLYIDDLDRCPPRKVVEVLEAVHLLLAFPLFVVVVGVDARWITRSLEARYGELLHVDGTPRDPAVALIGRATADDYLEKIFQIPFWIDTMDDRQTRRMVSGLLQGSLRQEPETEGGHTGPGGSGEDAGDRNVAGGAAGGEATGTATEEETGSTVPVLAAPNVESLDIMRDELAAMNSLAPLLGRSPRALKRFVNVYRLVKAGLTPVEYKAFVRPGGGSLSVLFLLAMDSGAPSVAPTVVRAIARAARKPNARSNGVAALRAALDAAQRRNGDPASTAGDRERLATWLTSRAAPDFVGDTKRLAHWAARVARYSFGSDTAAALRHVDGGPSLGVASGRSRRRASKSRRQKTASNG